MADGNDDFSFASALNGFTSGALQLIQSRNQIRAALDDTRDNVAPVAQVQESAGIPPVVILAGLAFVIYMVRKG